MKLSNKRAGSGAVLIILAVILIGLGCWLYAKYPYVRGHLHIFSPRIQGTVIVSDGGDEKAYSFFGNDGHGLYEWTVGDQIVPVHIELFNTNEWHVIKIDMRIERENDDWHVTGTVHCDDSNYKAPVEYNFTVPQGERIEMHFEDDSPTYP